jgi:hypothetical protein
MGLLKRVKVFVLHPTTHSRTMSLLTILLLASVLFINVVILQERQQITSKATSLELNSSATSMPTPLSEDYYATKLLPLRAQIASGNASSLNAKDGSYLTINSVDSSSYSYIEWIAEFTLPSQQVSQLSLSFFGKYSAYRGQYIYLYNYITSTWQKVDYRTVGVAGSNLSITSIANPTNYISPQGQVQIKTYSMSSGSYVANIDLLKISVKYADIIPTSKVTPILTLTPTSTPVSTPTLTLTPTLIPSPTSISAPLSEDYYATKLLPLRAQIASGNVNSLNAKDNSYLVINSVDSSGYSYAEWITEFTLPNRQVNYLNLSFSGKYSEYRRQYVYLYNYVTSSWQKIDYRNVGVAGTNLTVTVSSPPSYISSGGQVQIKISSMSSSSYTANVDLLKLNVKY